MLAVNPTPYSIPLNTAHVPTELVETQNRFAERIPESVPAYESNKNKGPESEQQLSDTDRAKKNAESHSQVIGSKDDKSEQGAKQKEEQQNTLNPEQDARDQAVIRDLAAIDRKVRAHE